MRRLFLAAFLVAALLTKTDPGSAHEYSRFGTVESLVDRGTFALDDSSFINTIDKVYRDGHFYSHQPPLLPVLEAPVYWALQLPGIRFNNRGRFVMTYLFILFTNGIALALTIVTFARLLELAGAPPRHRNALAILLVCGTWLLPYGIVSTNHGVSALLLMVLIHRLWVITEGSTRPLDAAAIGLLLGLLVAIEILPIVSFAPLVLLHLAWMRRFDLRGWAALAAGLAVPLILHAIFNIGITGDVIPAGFHAELFEYPGSVFDRSVLTGTIHHESIGAAAAYAWTALFAGKGLFTFAPLFALATFVGLAGWRWWSRARGLHLVLLVSLALSLGAAILTTNQFGGEAVGFRHAVYLSPAFLTLLLPWLSGSAAAAQRRVVVGVAVVSAVSMLVFAVRQPWFVLTVSNAHLGAWGDYLPLVSKIVQGNLFNPG